MEMDSFFGGGMDMILFGLVIGIAVVYGPIFWPKHWWPNRRVGK